MINTAPERTSRLVCRHFGVLNGWLCEDGSEHMVDSDDGVISMLQLRQGWNSPEVREDSVRGVQPEVEKLASVYKPITARNGRVQTLAKRPEIRLSLNSEASSSPSSFMMTRRSL